MADVVIQHCTLRVRRRNGWSWGSEPRGLLEAAMQALPELLAQRLALRWPDDPDLVIDTPLRLRIPISLNELRVGGGKLSLEFPGDSSLYCADLGRRIDSTFDAALGPAEVLSTETISPDETSLAEEWPNAISELRSDFAGAPLTLLLKWREQDLLETLLFSFSPASLEAWHQYLFAPATLDQTDESNASTSETDAFVRERAERLSRVALDRPELLRRRLLIAVSAAVQFKLNTITPAVATSIDRFLPSTRAATVDRHAPERDEAGAVNDSRRTLTPVTTEWAPPLSPSPRVSAVTLPSRPVEGEVRISSALPFLLLGPLARVGYLEALSATLETANLRNRSSLFALALAYKVLDPPERGWRRDQPTIATAAAFAGLSDPRSEPELVEFAELVSQHLSPLEALLRTSLIEGHALGQPLLLNRTDNGNDLVLIDVEGSFPITRSPNIEEMRAVLQQFGTNVLLIPKATAEPELLKFLDGEELLFITDAPPARDEQWRSLHAASERWWTNDLVSPDSVLFSAARQLSNAQLSATELWQELDARPSVPLAGEAVLDKHITFAASVALGTIAWMLWHEREPTAPQMAMSRFDGFDARVQFGREAVRVYLPRGRRYQDLFDHGLLGDVPGIPWLGERKVEFAGG